MTATKIKGREKLNELRQIRSTEKVTISYKPHDAQIKFAEAVADRTKRVVLFLAGIRSGKSYAAINELLKCIYVHKLQPALFWIIAPTYAMSQVDQHYFMEFAGTGEKGLIKHWIKHERTFVMKPYRGCKTHPKVVLKTAEDPDHLRGPSIGAALVDEGALIQDDCYMVLRGRLLDSGGPLLIVTSPKPPIKNFREYVYNAYIRGMNDPSVAVIKCRTDDNPNVPKEEIERLRIEYGPDLSKQELDAEFIQISGVVYKHFNYGRDVVSDIEIPKTAEILVGIDWGFSDPAGVLWVWKKDNTFYVVDEFYETKNTLEDLVDYMKARPLAKQVTRGWCGPEALMNSAHINRLCDSGRFPFRVYPARGKKDKEITYLMQGIGFCSSLFAEGRIKVHRKCVNFLTELGQYRYHSRVDHNAGEKPVDHANHLMDCLRVALYSEYGGLAPLPSRVGFSSEASPDDMLPPSPERPWKTKRDDEPAQKDQGRVDYGFTLDDDEEG